MNLTEIINAYEGIDKGHSLVEMQGVSVFDYLKTNLQGCMQSIDSEGRHGLGHVHAEVERHELEYKETKWANEPNAKDKKGNWKNRAFTDSNGVQQYVVPNSWYCNKRVIIRAMEAGLDLSKGKSELEKELASLGKTNKSARDKLKGVLDTARKLVAKMEEEESIDASPITNQIDVISNSL